jgi:hypothetical protein
MSFKGVEQELNSGIDIVPDEVRFVLAHPDDVVRHPRLSRSQKRALLASWASDRHALEGAPELRQLESGAVVRLDAIMDALRALDRDGRIANHREPAGRPLYRLLRRPRSAGRRSAQPDDDPPPPRPIRVRLRAAA